MSVPISTQLGLPGVSVVHSVRGPFIRSCYATFDGHSLKSLVPQQPKKKSPVEFAIVRRYCPGQSGDGLLARGNISQDG
jgi:hypothetical protein